MASKESVKRKGHHDAKASNKKQKAEDSSKSSSAQKREAKKERQSHRRHSDTVTESKLLWNKLRLKSNTPKETKELMEKVMKLIRGKVKEIALQHDASRVVQAAIQFGNHEQRKELLTEICDSLESLAECSKIQYAHFCCLKFIKCCARDNDCVKMIVKVGRSSRFFLLMLWIIF
jgi:pumilio family protein 6